jgi:hypothetical protein
MSRARRRDPGSLTPPEPLEKLQSHTLALAIAQRLRQRSVALPLVEKHELF